MEQIITLLLHGIISLKTMDESLELVGCLIGNMPKLYQRKNGEAQ